MLATQRHREILKLLDVEESVRVTELAKHFDVTEETIRRDLDRLQAEEKLTRSHGGAVTLEKERRELPLLEREMRNREEKDAMARVAASQVNEGDIIALDASSTAYRLSHMLADIPITVITNAHVVATVLSRRTHIRVISTGGTLDSQTMAYTGPMTDQALTCYHINTFFFSCRGLDPERGLSEASEESASTKRRLMELSDNNILLADHTKFGVRSNFFFASLQQVGRIITDGNAPPELVKKLESSGCSVEVVR